MILEFPFRMNWIAAVNGGEGILEVFWDTVESMNEIAITHWSMSDNDKSNIAYLNELFSNWDLPTFSIDGETSFLDLFPEEKILPFVR